MHHHPQSLSLLAGDFRYRLQLAGQPPRLHRSFTLRETHGYYLEAQCKFELRLDPISMKQEIVIDIAQASRYVCNLGLDNYERTQIGKRLGQWLVQQNEERRVLKMGSFNLRNYEPLDLRKGALITLPAPWAATPAITGVVQQAHCTLLANPVSADPVQLGTYTLADFTGPGSYTDAKDFYVTLSNCRDDPAGGIASAYIRLEGAKGSVPLEPAQGVFSLDNKPGSATGIGIQLLRSNDSPMPLQQDEAVTPLVVDKTVLHFKARFFQTAPTVTAGPANGALDFTMTYR